MDRHSLVKKIVLVVLITSSTFAVFAQQRIGHTLVINATVSNAVVFINAVRRGDAPLRVTLESGKYNITVRAPGYRDFQTTVNLNRNTTLNAELEPKTYTLAIRSNISRSRVTVNNTARGVAPVNLELTPGRYSVQVTADGYDEFVRTVELSENTTMNVSLTRITYRLSIRANVEGARVFVDGENEGIAPVNLELPPDRYTLRITASGYNNHVQNIILGEDLILNVRLAAATATIRVAIPNNMLNSNVRSPKRLIQILVDGEEQEEDEFELAAGTYTIGFVTGGIEIEREVEIKAGEEYTIRPSFSLIVREQE